MRTLRIIWERTRIDDRLQSLTPESVCNIQRTTTGIRESAAQAYAQMLDAQGYDTIVRLYLFGVDILTV